MEFGFKTAERSLVELFREETENVVASLDIVFEKCSDSKGTCN